MNKPFVVAVVAAILIGKVFSPDQLENLSDIVKVAKAIVEQAQKECGVA
jgi:hypothetical protein